MEIISERTIEQDTDHLMIVIINIRFQYSNNDIVLELIQLLGFLKQFYTPNENLMINLTITSDFYLWMWEKALYIASQRVGFPVPVFITQTAGVEEGYLKSSRSLEKFRRAIRSVQMVSVVELDDDDDDDDDSYDYETALKLTLLHFAQSNGMDEQDLEQVLQENHSLEEVLRN